MKTIESPRRIRPCLESSRGPEILTHYERARRRLLAHPVSWLITGVAGFVGSNLAESLLKLNQRIIGLDNFAAGKRINLEQIRDAVQRKQWAQFTFIEGDIRDLGTCRHACDGVDYVLHQAALCSVPQSIDDPIQTHESNVTGFLNMLLAARDSRVKRFVYAASCATYGDRSAVPQVEENIGNPLSPYAVSKYVNELYASVFSRCYALETIGLRYFNVFGPRQDPKGAYAAVIPKWISAMIQNEIVFVNGDGETSRDFCYVENVTQANVLAATTSKPSAVNQVYNVGVNARTSLNQLFRLLYESLKPFYPHLQSFKPTYRSFRPGDVRDSEADIGKAARLLGYEPAYTVQTGLETALEWYRRNL
jgi:UDP-N-acetylglucosamine/UDP-N-acetylgalactosamine 4-epimerase